MNLPPCAAHQRPARLVTEKRHWIWLVGCILTGWSAMASGQTFYKWVDTGGVVHFSDQPPANITGVEERQLTAPRATERKPDSGEQVVSTTAGEQPGTAAAKPAAPVPEGPARVILISRQAPRIGPSALHVIGEVKNVGGKDARRVAVALNSLDTTQGTPCLQEEAAVTPSTLHPGESGNFDVDLDSPCLFGQPEIDVAPLWE
jgi:hypothetical protein